MRSEPVIITKFYLKKGREESLKRFHPWVFSGAVERRDGDPEEGDIVEIYSKDGSFLAVGHYQVGSITIRVLSYEKLELDASGDLLPGFWEERFSKALSLRENTGVISSDTNAYRLIHGEGDGLPGLIVDFYNSVAVIQSHSAGMFKSREAICEALKRVYGDRLTSIYDKSSSTAPFKAGLDLKDGLLWGDAVNGIISENGVKFVVDWEGGQKTGFFLDQRDNRELVRKYSCGKRVLNLFCYTGGFSLYALKGGAEEVISVDSSSKAIGMVEKNLEANNFSDSIKERHSSVCADAIEYLSGVESDYFDMIIVDPPAFAKHRGALDNALRAYRRLNASAISKVKKGGIIFTFSCSQVVDRNAFYLAIFSAAAQTGRSVRIIARVTQPADHPVNIYHPEGEYLKGLILYVD